MQSIWQRVWSAWKGICCCKGCAGPEYRFWIGTSASHWTWLCNTAWDVPPAGCSLWGASHDPHGNGLEHTGFNRLAGLGLFQQRIPGGLDMAAGGRRHLAARRVAPDEMDCPPDPIDFYWQRRFWIMVRTAGQPDGGWSSGGTAG